MISQMLREAIAGVFSEVDVVLAYQQGFDKLHATPCFMTMPEEINKLAWSPLCVHNLTSYLPALKKKKVAVVVKGCDSRTVVQYIEEGLINRDNVVIIGIPCNGVISVNKVLHETNHEPIEDITFGENGKITVKTLNNEKTLLLSDVCPDKCKTCQYPTPIIYDRLVGDPITSDKLPDCVYDDIKEFENKTLEERLQYWEKEFDRCIRCYACRNACPMCICQDSCIAETRDPHWISQKSKLSEKIMFHMIHTLHLAGRCVECGECERACPMGIPVNKLKRKINLDMKVLYGYEPGVNPEDKPPMYTFKVDEVTIKEHKI